MSPVLAIARVRVHVAVCELFCLGSAVVWCKRAITPADVERVAAMRDVKVAQQTPGARMLLERVSCRVHVRATVRVLHRRALLTRRKVIHDMSVEVINAHYCVLSLTTSAGAQSRA